jgi:hypothetical protein
MVLGNNKGSANNADSQPEQQKSLIVLGQPDTHYGYGAKYQQASVGQAGANSIAQPANKQAGQNSDGYGGNDRVANLATGEAKVIPYQNHQGCDAKPAEEGQEKGEPGHVKSPHVGAGETQ